MCNCTLSDFVAFAADVTRQQAHRMLSHSLGYRLDDDQ